MAKEPPWAAIGREMYREGGLWSQAKVERFFENADYTFEGEEWIEPIIKMYEWGLVDREMVTIIEPDSPSGDRREEPHFSLSSEGFNVVHDREMNRQQNRTNRVLAIFTAGLFITALIQAQVAYLGLGQGERIVFGLILLFIMAAALGLLWVFDIL